MTVNRPTNSDVDIVIVGGGLVGSALACALGGSEHSVLVVEAGRADTGVPETYDLRVSAITGASRNLFESIGAWDDIQAMRLGQVRDMRVWDQGGSGSLHLDAAETGEGCLAYIIENSIIRSALYKCLQDFTNVRYQENAVTRLVSVDDETVTVAVNDKPVRARLVVGADGARSVVREWAGIPVSGWSFEQSAIVATIGTEHPHEFTAWQRFLATGPLAFLPLDNVHRSSIVWSADTGRAQELLALDDESFIEQLGDAFEHRLGNLQLCSKRAAFPLSLMQAQTTVGHRMVLVGDAAHRVHPLAGQGLNLGLADVAALAEVLQGARDVGAMKHLRRYERWRAGDTGLMVRLMDLFKRLYGSEQPAMKGLRNFGMDLANSNSVARQLVMAFAAGSGGDVPGLLTGRQQRAGSPDRY